MKRSPNSAEGRRLANETACARPPRASKAFPRGGEKLALAARMQMGRWAAGERAEQGGKVGLELVSPVNLAV